MLWLIFLSFLFAGMAYILNPDTEMVRNRKRDLITSVICLLLAICFLCQLPSFSADNRGQAGFTASLIVAILLVVASFYFLSRARRLRR